MKCVIDQKRETDRPLVCEPCRRGLASDLRELVDAYAVLSAPDERPPSRLLVEDDGSFDGPAVYDVLDLGSGPVRAPNASARVSGSREAPVPVSLDLVDLTSEARSGRVRDTLVPLVHTREVDILVRRVDRVVIVRKELNDAGEEVDVREVTPVNVEETQRRHERIPVHGGYGETLMVPAGDQIGELPVATKLDQWVREWITYGWCPGDHLPVPTVVTLVDWLSKRLDVACDHHPAIDEFATEIRDLLRTCRRHAGLLLAHPEYLDGVPCSGCDLMALFRKPGDDYRAECGSCGKLYTDEEYERWVGLVAAQVRAA